MTAKGHFFVVSLEAIQKIVKSGGLAEEVMSYLVLARHTQGRGQWQRLFSTSGAKAIHLKTGIPYRKATRSLHWLEKAGIIIPMNETIRRSSPHLPEHFGKIKTLATTIRWVLHDFSEPFIYLANALIDGTQGIGEKNRPLMRIMDNMPISTSKKAEMKLDALILLLILYFHHELDEFGGVNPNTALYGQWERTLEVVEDNPLLPFQKYAISKHNNMVIAHFVNETLFYIPEEKIRFQRFWDAFENLKRLGFIYEVIQIWDDDPITTPNAEILYPLYILDRHARQSEPHLAKAIHQSLINSELPCDISELFNNIDSGVFRYLAYPEHYPLGIFRLRFRPKVIATGRWLKSETSKVNAWKSLLSDLLE